MIHSDARTAPAADSSGYTAPGFEGVREAFESNLRNGDDLGASVAVYLWGKPVVDLWGGLDRPAGDPYPEDALHVGYSVTKGVLGLLLAHLADTGELDLDARVSDYWPEFGTAGKERIDLRQLASHQAGLPAFELPLTIADLGDWEMCTKRLANQAPAWTPGAAHGYHALTLGYLLGEVALRATGRTVGRLVRERLCGDSDVQAWIGLPLELSHRVIPSVQAPPTPGVGEIIGSASVTPGTLTYRAFNNPQITVDTFNDPVSWRPEIPAANGVFDARSLARLYSSVVDGPLRSIGEKTVNDMRRPQVHGADLVLLDQPTRFGTGFLLPSPRQPMLDHGSFGHDGMGGHLAFANPEAGIAFAYLTNRAILDPSPHTRLWRLVSAVAAAI